jgi:hypothetical protein
MQKELNVVIAKIIKESSVLGEVGHIELAIEVEAIEGYQSNIKLNIWRSSALSLVGGTATQEVEAKTETNTEPKSEKKTTGKKVKEDLPTSVHFKDQPIEIAAALLVLFGAKANYTSQEIDKAGELIASDSHGNTEALASDILAVFQDCNNPIMLNTAIVNIGAKLVDWWDDLADHAARVNFFTTLKNTRSDQRDTVEPVIYWKADDGSVGELTGKGQLAVYSEVFANGELAGTTVEPIDAKEFAKLNKTTKSDKPVDFTKLRDEGLALVRAKAATHRDGIGEVLTKFNALNPDTNKPSWGFISDENLVDGVAALKAL